MSKVLDIIKGLEPTLTSEGLHLGDSILWLDSFHPQHFSFISTAQTYSQLISNQVLATEETAKILQIKNKSLNILSCQYNRPFSIGKLKLELLPSGYMLGSSNLYIEMDGKSLLYAPKIQYQKSVFARKIQCKKTDTLVLRADHPDPNVHHSTKRKDKDDLLNEIKLQLDLELSPIIYCNPLGIAQELIALLTQTGYSVSVHPYIYRINKIYDQYSSQLGRYHAFGRKKNANGHIRIYPMKKESVINPNALWVHDTWEKYISENDKQKNFYFINSADGLGIQNFIQTASPQTLLFLGPYAKSYAKELKHMASVVDYLFTDGLSPLF